MGVRKLTKENVVDIWGRLLNHEECASIAKDYPCTPQNIMSIEKGQTWRHVTDNLLPIKAKPVNSIPVKFSQRWLDEQAVDDAKTFVPEDVPEKTLIDEIIENARPVIIPAVHDDEPPMLTATQELCGKVDKLCELQSHTNYLLKCLFDEWCK